MLRFERRIAHVGRRKAIVALRPFCEGVGIEGHGATDDQCLRGWLTMRRVDIARMPTGQVRQRSLICNGVGHRIRCLVGGEPTPPATGATPPVSSSTPRVGARLTPVSAPASPVGTATHRDEVIDRVRPPQVAQPDLTPQHIQAVCAEDYLTVRQIADVLGRSKKRLQDDFLGSMCATGMLAMRYPDTPNHRQRAYRTNIAIRNGEAP